MADGYDRFDNEGGGSGSSFVMGLLTGTVLGAGLGMLFAPKSGSELRGQISDQAGNLANAASDQYRRATAAANDLADRATAVATDLADRGREAYGKARDAVARGTEEAQRYVREVKGASQSSSTPGAGSASESFNGSSSEQARGSTRQS